MALGAIGSDLGVAFGVTTDAEKSVLGGLAGASLVGDLGMKIDAGGLGTIYAKGVHVGLVCTEGDAALGTGVWEGGGRALAAIGKRRILACAALGTNCGPEELGGHKRPPFEGMHVAP